MVKWLARSLISLPSVPRLGRGGGVNIDASSMANADRPPTRLVMLFALVRMGVMAAVDVAAIAGADCCTSCRLFAKPDVDDDCGGKEFCCCRLWEY